MAGAGGGFGVGCRGFAGPVTGKTASGPIGEFDQIDLLALAVSGGFQEVDDAQKARAPGEVRGYVGKVDLADSEDMGGLMVRLRLPRAKG